MQRVSPPVRFQVRDCKKKGRQDFDLAFGSNSNLRMHQKFGVDYLVIEAHPTVSERPPPKL